MYYEIGCLGALVAVLYYAVKWSLIVCFWAALAVCLVAVGAVALVGILLLLIFYGLCPPYRRYRQGLKAVKPEQERPQAYYSDRR